MAVGLWGLLATSTCLVTHHILLGQLFPSAWAEPQGTMASTVMAALALHQGEEAGLDASGHPQGHLRALQHHGMRWSLRGFQSKPLWLVGWELVCGPPLWTPRCHRKTQVSVFCYGRGLCWWEAMAGKAGKGLLILGSGNDALESSLSFPSAQLKG